MQIIPAIDLLQGSCVRLHQGDYDQVTRFSEDPVAQALEWQRQGASRLHLVHQMQSASPLALPFQGLRHRVFTEARDLVVIALVKPDAGALQQVDGGDDLHGAGRSLPPSSPTAVSAECCGIQAGGRWKS